MICDQCETVAHCLKNGCVPKQKSVDRLLDEAKLLADDRPVEVGNLPEWTLDAEHMIRRLVKALAEQPAPVQQEPAALFKWLPKGATHIGLISVRTAAGGSLAMTTHAFKYDSAVLKVYVTDNDNEYPGWRDAKDCFFHLNFPVLPLYTAPPAQRKPLTVDEINDLAMQSGAFDEQLLAFARAIEAAHGIKENT